MAEETQAESGTTEIVVEPSPIPESEILEPTPEATPVPEPVQNTEGSNGSEGVEGVKVEEISTAQPVEPLNPEPISEPQPSSESMPEPIPVPLETEPASKPVSSPQPSNSTPPIIQTSLARELLVQAREAIQFRKRKKLEKIMILFLKKQSIINDDVEKLLHVSDATATRYLEQLEREGRIKQTGTAKGSSYSRI